MAGGSEIPHLEPEYIKFLLDPQLRFGCYFIVGNPEMAPVEKIGVVRKMLSAHSEVFRAQLLDRWDSKEPDEITDVLPGTFKNLLRFVYGWDTTDTMSFDEADDLLYAAERYIMTPLKNKLARRLMSLLDYTNVCSLLTNPACATVLELRSSINKILQCETDMVFGSPMFLACCTDTFVKILEQEVMNVTEVLVWKAAVEWAKNQAQKKEGAKSLRMLLEKPLQHIRVCTLSSEEFCKEVIPADILTPAEVAAVRRAIGTNSVSENLTTVCNNMRVRQMSSSVDYVKSEELKVGFSRYVNYSWSKQHRFSLQTHDVAVEITQLHYTVFIGADFYSMKVEIDSRRETTTLHTGLRPIFDMQQELVVSTEQRPVVLSANSKYNITLTSNTDFMVFGNQSSVMKLAHFTLEFQPYGSAYASPVRYISYKMLTF